MRRTSKCRGSPRLEEKKRIALKLKASAKFSGGDIRRMVHVDGAYSSQR